MTEATHERYQPFETNDLNGGVQYRYRFPNGWGASVVRSELSYGHETGLWELAVVDYHTFDDGRLSYDTPITDDVIGWLTWDAVEMTLAQVEALPNAGVLSSKRAPYFYNVNEDGTAYDSHIVYDDALARLSDHPADTIVVSLDLIPKYDADIRRQEAVDNPTREG